MNRQRSIFVGAAALLILAAIIFMPLRTVLPDNVLTARKVEGIVWDGSIRDLQIGRVAVGDVNARLHFLPLLLGRAQMSFSRGDAPFAPGVSGKVTRRPGGYSIEGLTATVSVATLFQPLPAENLQFTDFSVRFRSGRCAEASGSVRLTAPAGVAGLDLPNGLLGKPRCDGGDLLIPLLSQSAMEHVDIRIGTDRSYSATVLIEGDRVEQAAMLALAGFQPVAGGYRLVRKGRF
ncbi:MAG: type II secretion system protein N [Sphingomonadaceae bacterium]|nr:type II secretion system protein N [Sphingomonadaceae bacterium]